MYSYSDIRSVHIELTERCNAACPQCPRRIDGGKINPKLTMAELSLGDIKRLFPKGFVQSLKKVYFCGNYGDPAAAAEALAIAQYFRIASQTLQLGIHSNGSLRSEAWWRQLAKIFGTQGYARFAIDGLQDTNEIYRRNTSWEKIIANARAFIAAGGRAEWDFIVFAHNEHQVESAEAFAQNLGFASFHVKRTQRFIRAGSIALAATPIKAADGTSIAMLEPPQNPVYRAAPATHPSEIACKAVAEKSVYIDAQGQIYPCCWIAAMEKNPASPQTQQYSALVGATATCEKSIEAAVKSHLFQKTIPGLWSGPDRLKVCARACGKS